MSVERQLFPSGAQHAPWLRALLALDGSTTRVCEAVAGQPMGVLLLHQAQQANVPAAVREQLGGDNWLVRVTSLYAHGRVLMDNLSYTRLDAVPDWFLADLHQGQAPIGHLLRQLPFVRRDSLPVDTTVAQTLWDHVGHPDAHASRSYRIVTPEKPLMLIFEAFRDGMVMAS
jgi:chorismate-pyruvate lyase